MKTSDSKKSSAVNLRRMILTMELKPGAPLDEAYLAERLGISRTPLREIIQRLSGEGYLELEKNRGAKVSSMDISTMSDFFQSAPMVYAAIARLAAERANHAGIEKLKTLQSTFRRSIKNYDPSKSALLNHEFHREIGLMANNPYLMSSLERLLIDHARIGQTFYQASSDKNLERILKAADQHDQMIEAFERYAPTDAVNITLEHWELSRNNLERFVQPDPLPYELGKVANEL